MLPRLYPRPFEKPPPIFSSGAAGGRALRDRIALLRTRYRRAVAVAAVSSAAAHGLFGFVIRNEAPLAHPDPIAGYREGIEIIELAPLDPELPSDRDVSPLSLPAGALVAIEVETAPDPESEGEAVLPAARVSAPEERRTGDVSSGLEVSDEPIRIELREDWSVDPSSPEAAYSDQFNPLRLIVPEYPPLAFAQDIQGLVKLEAEVGTNGKVLQVHVLEAADGSLAMAAAHALLLWEFRPFVYRGEPRPFRIVVPFRFRIKE
jgi:protein TonB